MLGALLNLNCLKNTFKIYLKIHLKKTPLDIAKDEKNFILKT